MGPPEKFVDIRDTFHIRVWSRGIGMLKLRTRVEGKKERADRQ